MEDRNFNLTSRKEDTRDKFHTEVIRFNSKEILQHFLESINAIKRQFALADELLENNRNIEAENIWRAQVIFLASSFDFYMHELTKYGLCEIYDENWDKTEKYSNIQIKMKILEVALKSGEDIDWFLDSVNNLYRTVTMVSYESVKDQFNLLGIDLSEVAYKSFYQRGSHVKPKDKLRKCLEDLYNRRNFIAHQADRTHTDAQIKDITKEMVEGYISDIQKIVKSIDEEINTKTIIDI